MRTIRLLLAAALLAAMIAVPASADVEPAVAQAISGSVLVPNPTKAAQPVTRHTRSAMFVGPEAQGVVSWFFEVDPATVGGTFELTSSVDADLDIIFYSDPGGLNATPTASGEFVGTGVDGEAGIIPLGSTHATIYPASGATVPFDYAGFEAQQVLLSGDLDVEIRSGQRLVFVNDTDQYGFVRGEKFSSGDGPASGMPAGATFTYDGATALFGTVTIPYETHMGSGTITVTTG